MRDGEPNIYGALATLRNGQTQLQWSRIQMFLVFNTIAVPLVLGVGQSEVVKIALSCMGLVLHVAILIAAMRGDRWIQYWDSKMSFLELVDPNEDPANIRIQVFSDTEFGIIRSRRISSRWIFGPIGAVFLGFWIEETFRHIWLYFHA